MELLPLLTFGLSGMIRGEVGSWVGGMVVGFLGGLSLGLAPIRHIIFTILCTGVCSLGYGKYIKAVQTDKGALQGWLRLTGLNLLYLLPALCLLPMPYSQVVGDNLLLRGLGWGLLAWPCGLFIDDIMHKIKWFDEWDRWKCAEFAIWAIIGYVFWLNSDKNIPIQQFPLIINLFVILSIFKFMTTEKTNNATIMLFLLAGLGVNIAYYWR